MASLVYWAKAARPKTLIAILSPLWLATTLGAVHHRFDPLAFFWMMTGGLALQLLLNFANDYYDYQQGFDTPRRIGPTRMVAAGMISPQKMRFAMLGMNSLIFLSLWGLFSRGGWPFVWLALISGSLAICYSKEPICLSKRGLGEIFVLIFFGPVALIAASYTYLSYIPIESIYLGFGCGLISTALIAAANLRDIEEDSLTGKRTLAVRYGMTAGRIEVALFLLLSLVVTAYLPSCRPAAFALLLPLATLLQTLYRIKNPIEAIHLMPKIALFLFLYTLGCSICLWLFFEQ